MANTVIQLKWSDVTDIPPSLNVGEPAYSNTTQKLFIGDSSSNVIEVGGKYYVDQQNIIFNAANSKVSKTGDTMTGPLQFFGSDFAIGQYQVGAGNGIDFWANNNTNYAQINFANTNFVYVDSGVAAIQSTNATISAYTTGNAVIWTSSDGGITANTWTFGPSGSLTFPDNTVQTTAYSGFSIDNVARDTANSSSSYANAAFALANTGSASSSYANSAFLKANTPDYVANSAASYANSAFGVANAAFTTSNGTIAWATANSSSSYANSAFLKANTPDYVANSASSYANAAFGVANSALTSTNGAIAWATANSAASYGNSAFGVANSAFTSSNGAIAWTTANSSGVYANSAFAAANAATATDATQNTNISSAASYANSAFGVANSALTSTNGAIAWATANAASSYANSAFGVANNALTSTNGSIAWATANSAASYGNSAFGVANSALTNANGTIAWATANAASSYANAAFLKANTPDYVANSAASYANSAFGVANSALTSTNGSIAWATANSAASYGNSAFSVANSALTSTNGAIAWSTANSAGVYANSAFGVANNALTSTNGAIAWATANSAASYGNSSFGVANSAGIYANSAFLKANTPDYVANSAASYANSAYTRANNSINANTGGTITGSLTITGGDLSVTGNLIISGNTVTQNVTTLNIADPLIYLAANNYSSDVVDIGFAGNYFDGVTQRHAGLVRHAADDTFYLFKNYALEPVNNVIDIANNTFRVATLNANISSISVLSKGVDLLTQANAAFLQANTPSYTANSAASYANSAFLVANTPTHVANSASSYANSAFGVANSALTSSNGSIAWSTANSAASYANSAFGVANTVTSASSYANSAFLKANTPDYVANSAASYANAAFTYANTSLQNTGPLITVNSSSVLYVSNSTSSINTTTGALVVNGGVGITGNLSLNLSSSGTNVNRLTLSQSNYLYSDDATLGSIVFAGTRYYYFNASGGLYNQNAFTQRGIIKNDTGNNTLIFAGSSPVLLQNSTQSSSNTTGALVVQGGVGITGNLYAGGLYVTGTSNGITFVDGTKQTTNAYPYQSGLDVSSYANSAFLVANTPTHVANSAASYANSGFAKANNALANTSGTFEGNLVINSAVSGNAFVIQAEPYLPVGKQYWTFATQTGIGAPYSSYMQWPDGTRQLTAFTGSAVDQTARDTANNAFTSANGSIAWDTANSASSYANSAFLKANTPDYVANSAASYANSAFGVANTALQSSGWFANTILVANSTGYLVNSAMRFDSSISQLHSMSNVSIGTTAATAPLTVNKLYTSATGGEQFGQFNGITYGVADSSLKQGLRLSTGASHTTGTMSNLIGELNLLSISGVGGTTTIAYNNWSRTDVAVGAYLTDSINYASLNGAGAGYANNQYGFFSYNLTKGVNNYGYYGAINTGANNAYNLYMIGSAPNYLAGSLTVANSVSSTSNTTGGLKISGGLGVVGNIYSGGVYITGASNGITFVDGTIQTTNSYSYQSGLDVSSYANSAFLKANTPDYVANSAASYANAAFAAANTGSGSSSAGPYANAAFAVANSASSYANSAFAAANTGSGSSSAGPYANAAFAVANTALQNTGPIITTNSSAILYVSNTTTSNSFNTGALVVNGGIGANGNLYIKGASATWAAVANSNNYQMSMSLNDNLGSLAVGWGTTSLPGQFMTMAASGGRNYIGSAARDFYILHNAGTGFYLYGSQTSILLGSTEASTNSTSGALKVSGGLGVAGNLNVGGVSANLSTGGGSWLSVLGGSNTGTQTVTIAAADPTGLTGNSVNMFYAAQNGGYHSFRTGAGQIEQFRVAPTSVAVNYLQVSGNTTGNNPTLSAQGTDTNISISLQPKGSGNVDFTTSNGLQVRVADATATGQYTVFSRDNPNNMQLLGAAGTANFGLYATGGGSIRFFSSPGAVEQFRVSSTGSAVNYTQITGSIANSSPIVSAQGTSANVGINLLPKGNASVLITGNTVGYIPQANSLYVGSRVGFADANNTSVVYQSYNPATSSLDTVFG